MQLFIDIVLVLLTIGAFFFIIGLISYLYEICQDNMKNRQIARAERIEIQRRIDLETEKGRKIAEYEWRLSQYKTSRIREVKNEATNRILWNNYYSLQNGEAHVDKMQGWEFENFVGNLYNQMGYEVTITKKSGDFGADIIVARDSKKTAIQSKRQIDKVGVKAINEVLGGKGYYKCRYAAVVTNSTFTNQAKSTASANKVQLIDGEELSRLCSTFLTHSKPYFDVQEFERISNQVKRFARYPDAEEINSFISSHPLAAKYVYEIENTKTISDDSTVDYNYLFTTNTKEIIREIRGQRSNMPRNIQLNLFLQKNSEDNQSYNFADNVRKKVEVEITSSPDQPPSTIKVNDLKQERVTLDINIDKSIIDSSPIVKPINLENEIKKIEGQIVEKIDHDWFVQTCQRISMNDRVLNMINKSGKKVKISNRKMVLLNVEYMLYQSYGARIMKTDIIELIDDLAEKVIIIDQKIDKLKYLQELIYGFIDIEFFLKHEGDPYGFYSSCKILRQNRLTINETIEIVIRDRKIDVDPQFSLYIKSN